MKIELNRYIKQNKTFDETDLFREMSKYLSKSHNSLFIEETHQHYVNFISPTTGCQITRREISDLWMISYSPKKKKAKMTFLQAKLLKNKKSVTVPFKFKGDFYQYDLLANRPKINDLSGFKFPKFILKNAVSDAIGTYGIFYYDNKNRLDFSFSVANDLIRNKKKVNCNTKIRTLYFEERQYFKVTPTLPCPKIYDIELRNTISADCFEFSLLNLFVGSPISEKDRNLIIFLKRFFSNIKGTENFIEFLNIYDVIDENNNNFEVTGSPNILLLNTDIKE